MSCSYITPVPRKYFTLAEANRTLPLVKRIVADLVTLHPEWRDLVSKYELVAAQARPEWGESAEQVGLRARIDEVAGRINDYLGELEQVGCVFKGFEQGLWTSTASSTARKYSGAGSRVKKKSSTGMT